MRPSIFYILFIFSFLESSLSCAYIPSHGTIEFFAPQPQKNNMHWGVSPTHIQLPYEIYKRRSQKKSSQKKSKKSEQRKQDIQHHQHVKTTADKEHVQQPQYQQLCKQIEGNFQGQYHEFKQYCAHEYGDCSQELYTVLNRNGRLEKRFAALQNIEHAGAHYAHCKHVLTHETVNNLKALGYDLESYKFCYGNQIQQVIHEDCITLLQETSTIPFSAMMYSRVPAITDCIDAARAYNQAAECIKACTIQDFCWTLLEYGKAVAEGAVWGAVSAVQDCLQHPLHTAACVIIPEGVLVYQLSKVLVNVVDIGATYLFDKEKGKCKLHDYIAPLTQIIHALQNKQLSGPEIVRSTTQLAIHWKAQSKLLGGLSKLYTTSKIKVEQFIKENPFAAPEQYMATPEGVLLKCTDEALILETHPPHCAGQYEALKGSLTIEQFTSIIKTTKHGIQRLIQRRFTPEDVLELVKNPTYIRMQTDGAKVFIKEISNNVYNYMVLNEVTEEVVTCLKKIDMKALEELGNNYGWKL